MNGRTELAMPQDTGIGIILLQLPEQVKQGAPLRISARIGRTPLFIESAFITDAEAFVIPTGGMGTNLMGGTANVHLSVTGDVEMITDIGKAPCQMAATKRCHGKLTVATRSTAMNYQEVHLPIVLIKTACLHPAND